ncbi:MAG: hypothetical protein Tsb0020_33200 [Haliangiales bacterium]
MITRTNHIVAFALAALILSSGTAFAGDVIYPGSSCQSTHEKIDYSVRGSVANSDLDNERRVVCPIIKHNPADLTLDSVTVFLRDEHSSRDIECNVIAHDMDGNDFDVSPTVATTGSGSTAQILQMASVQGAQDGYYTLQCTLPRKQTLRSHVLSYIVTE